MNKLDPNKLAVSKDIFTQKMRKDYGKHVSTRVSNECYEWLRKVAFDYHTTIAGLMKEILQASYAKNK